MMSSEGSDAAERGAGWARAGQYDPPPLGGSRRTARRAYEDLPSVPHEPIPGRALATPRAVMGIVRAGAPGAAAGAGGSGRWGDGRRLMARRACDGAGLLGAFRAAVANLELHVDEINGLNVFPVPDGGPGSNTFATVKAA